MKTKSHTELTVRRPNGAVEVVTVPYVVLPEVYKKMVAATASAGKGEILSYRVVSEPVPRTIHDRVIEEGEAIERAMRLGED